MRSTRKVPSKEEKREKDICNERSPPSPRVEKPNEIWAMDFMSDSYSTGRKTRMLNILDIYARECLQIEVASSLPSSKVISVLGRLAIERGLPGGIIIDSGPEHTSKELKE